jgi:hypothetical protein
VALNPACVTGEHRWYARQLRQGDDKAHLIQRRDTIFHVPKRKRDSAMVPRAGTCRPVNKQSRKEAKMFERDARKEKEEAIGWN